MALENAKIKKEDLSYSFFGVAGYNSEIEGREIEKIINKLNIGDYDYHNDGWLSLSISPRKLQPLLRLVMN